MEFSVCLRRLWLVASLLLPTVLWSGRAHACSTAAWDAQSGGNLAAVQEAAYEGLCGLRLSLGGSTASWVEDATPGGLSPAVDQYVARVYLFAAGASVPTGQAVLLLQALDAGDSELFGLELVGSGAGNTLRIRARDSSGSLSSNPVALPYGWRALELSWLAQTGSGSLVLLLDGQQALSLSGLDNGGLAVAKTRLGLVAGAAASASGILDLDSFRSRRTGSNGLVEKACSGDVLVVTDTTFLPGTRNCAATGRLTLGERVAVDPGASLSLVAPVVELAAGSRISTGAVLSVNP